MSLFPRLLFVATTAGLVSLGGCADSDAMDFREPDYGAAKARIRDSIDVGTAAWVNKTFVLDVPGDINALAVAGWYVFKADGRIRIANVGGTADCVGVLDDPSEWQNREFRCGWKRGNATWGGQWQVEVGAEGAGRFGFGFYF